MMTASIHCASCRVDLKAALETAVLAECRHLFCEACFSREFNHSTRRFTCPLDWSFSSGISSLSLSFQQAGERWKQANTQAEAVQYYQALLSCLNFTLYPCTQPANHPGFEACPFDHSLQSMGPPLSRMLANYCDRCRVFTQSTICPRCNASSRPRERPVATFSKASPRSN